MPTYTWRGDVSFADRVMYVAVGALVAVAWLVAAVLSPFRDD